MSAPDCWACSTTPGHEPLRIRVRARRYPRAVVIRAAGRSYTGPMLFAQDTVWHFWLAVPLAALAVGAVIAIIALYFFKVTRARYPRDEA